MKLSVIIVSWNTCDLLGCCLQSIYDSLVSLTPAGIEIFVVDNASHDGSASMVQERFPQVHLIQNSTNTGFAHANNQALHLCAGEYILLLNPDTRLHSGALEALVEFMDSNPSVGATGSRLLNADGGLQISCHPAPTLTRELWRLLHLDRLYPHAQYRMHQWVCTAPREVEVVQGASMLVRGRTFEQTGPLDEDYFIYTEEVDWCYRMRKAGWRIFWVPTSVVTHYGGQSTSQVAEPMFLLLYQTKLLYFRKHHGHRAAQIYKIILYLAGLVRVLCSPLMSPLNPAGYRQRALIARNYRRLLAALPGL
jgi:N-acetylglucosaminyl-diphospho-decaprenol L-rhamnosyltransferase